MARYRKIDGEWYDTSSGGGENYSTTEQVIGTWIDGKPLYRKVYLTTPSGININTSKTDVNQYITNSSEIDTVVNASMMRPTNFYGGYGSMTSQGACYIENNIIKIYSGSIALTNITHIILEYTKKAD